MRAQGLKSANIQQGSAHHVIFTLMTRKCLPIDSFKGFGRNPEGATENQPAEVTASLLQSFKWLQPVLEYLQYLVGIRGARTATVTTGRRAESRGPQCSATLLRGLQARVSRSARSARGAGAYTKVSDSGQRKRCYSRHGTPSRPDRLQYLRVIISRTQFSKQQKKKVVTKTADTTTLKSTKPSLRHKVPRWGNSIEPPAYPR